MNEFYTNPVNSDPETVSGRKRISLLQSTSALVLGAAMVTGINGTANAAEKASASALEDSALALEEIVVTARKTSESLQDVPVSINVLGNSVLDDHGVTNFQDFAAMIPSLTMVGAGPGNSQIFIRGINSGGDGNPSTSSPSVGVYLDEQPVTVIGRTLDVHMYDIARVEALAGPQGTLYGASSQSGTVRIITNQPDPSGFEAGYDVGAAVTKSGDPSYSIEGFINLPVSDNIAVRFVGWNMRDGGYIDNVASSRTFQMPDGPLTVNNATVVEENYNVEENTGFRAALKIDLDESWTTSAKVQHQNQKITGGWEHDPKKVGDLQVDRYLPEGGQDKFTQLALTVEGEIGGLNLIYAGSYLDRDYDLMTDYSAYSVYETAAVSYYVCDFGVDYVLTNCLDPNQGVRYNSEYKTMTHEARLQSDQERRLRFITGAFYQKAEHEYDDVWYIPTLPDSAPYFVNGLPKTADNNPTGNLSGHAADAYFVTDQFRTDTETALFGEVTFDVTENLTATGGARFFKTKTELTGSNGTFWWNGLPLDLLAEESGQVFKINLNYQIDEDLMIYATWSEGFRPAGINRDNVPEVPQIYGSDKVTNYEFGWKTTLADGRIRFNGAAFLMDWSDIQLGLFDPAISPLGLVANIGSARVKGVEADFSALITEGWTVSGSFSYIDAKLTSPYFSADGKIPSGTRLPSIPKFKSFISTRYDFEVGELNAYVMGSWNHVSSSFSDIEYNLAIANAEELRQKGYDVINLSAGIDQEDWGVTFFVNNVTDKRAELSHNAIDWDYPHTITTNRPRTFGLRFKQRFN